MSREQERGPDPRLQDMKTGAQAAKSGAQAAKSGTQAAQKLSGGGAGTSSGAAATGTSTTTTGTTTATRERTSMSSQSARGTSAGYRTEAGAGAGVSSGTMLGGVLTVVAGLLSFFAGLAAVVRQAFYPTLPNYAYRLNIHSWGWILLVLGVLLFAAGACHLLGMAWARAAGVGLAVLTAIAAFLFLPYTPIWATILVLLSVVAIWGLLRNGSSADRSDSM